MKGTAVMAGQQMSVWSGSDIKIGKDPLLEIDEKTFLADFDRSPFLIKHRLIDHPLFEIGRLMTLAQSLPQCNVEYNAGSVGISCDPNETPRTGLSAEETIRRIEECRSWMVLKNVELDSEYRSLLDDCLAEVQQFSEKIRPGLMKREAFIFLTSPGSITPYHMDPEHNFLLQIKGSKFMTVFDRSLVSAENLEAFYQGAHRNMPFKDDYLAKSTVFELLPGDGLHVPVCAPHFVRNGSGVSVSFSITFRTPDLEDQSLVHQMNGSLRRLGLHPRPVGRNAAADAFKVMGYRAWRKSRMLLGRNA